MTKKNRITDKVDQKLASDAKERLVTARCRLMIRHPFVGNIATRLQLIEASDWCSTAATDGLKFYYNSEFIMSLKFAEVVFLVGHEVLHVCYDHMGRRGNRDPKLHNIAADFAVNAALKRHNVGDFITTVPCLYDVKYEGKTSEEIYDLLLQEQEQQQKNGKGKGGKGGGDSLDEMLDKMLDEHMDEADDSDGGDDKDGSGAGKRPKMTKAEREAAKQEIKQAIIAAAQASDPGSIPGGVARMIKDMTEPKMNWKELLKTTLVSPFKEDYSFMRPSRRSHHLGVVMPGQCPGEHVNLLIGLDMSGSIGEAQARIFLSEVQGIMDSFSGYTIKLMCWDTAVYSVADYTSENLESLTDYEIAGGGGTDVNCVFQWCIDNEFKPDRMVIFTDGYLGGDWGPSDFCDCVWIVHGDRDPQPTHGLAAVYDEPKN